MRTILTILAEGEQSPPPGGFGSLLLPFAVMFLIVWLIVLRPQKKERDRRAQMMENLKKNDRVVTAGGIHGVITAVRDAEVTIRIDDARDVKIKVNRNAVTAVLSESEKDTK